MRADENPISINTLLMLIKAIAIAINPNCSGPNNLARKIETIKLFP
jgi:hypothetical protein